MWPAINYPYQTPQNNDYSNDYRYNYPNNYPNNYPDDSASAPSPSNDAPLEPVRLGPPTPPAPTKRPFQWNGFALPTQPPNFDFQFAGVPTTSGPDWVNVPINQQQPYFPPQQQAAVGGGGGMGGIGGMGAMGGMGGMGGMGMHNPVHGR